MPSIPPIKPIAEWVTPVDIKPADPAPSEWAVLGSVRFVLAAIVMFEHFQNVVNPNEPLYKVEELGAMAAVIGFFLISGYSIANSIAHKPRGYFKRRFFRIYPLYFTAWALGAFIYCVTRPVEWPTWTHSVLLQPPTVVPPPSALDLIGCAFFLQGFAVNVMEINSPLWSLSIEVFYYAFAPLLRKTPVKLLFLIVGLSALLYYTGWHPIHQRAGVHLFQTYARQIGGFSAAAFAWAWVLGFAFYFTSENWIARVALITLPVYLICGNNELGVDYSAFTLAAVALSIIYARKIKLGPRAKKVLNYLGDLSYPLYLVHVPIIAYTWFFFKSTNPFLYIAMSVGASVAMFHGVDKPLRHPKH